MRRSLQKLEQLAEAVHAIETRDSTVARVNHSPVPTGWNAIDDELGGGLRRGCIHEWFSDAWGTPPPSSLGRGAFGLRGEGAIEVQETLCAPSPQPSPTGKGSEPASRLPMQSMARRAGRWFPPLTILLHLSRCALAPASESNKLIVWIGRRCWPSAAHQHQSQIQNPKSKILDASLFIDPPDDAARVWAIDLALRSPAVAAVIADGSKLDMAHTRRLQLAAETGNALGLFARPAWELNTISAARTRWCVRQLEPRMSQIRRGGNTDEHGWENNDEVKRRKGEQVIGATSHRLFTSAPAHLFNLSPRWRIQLLRCKGVRPASDRARGEPAERAWTVEMHRAESGFHFPADVADRSDPAAAA